MPKTYYKRILSNLTEYRKVDTTAKSSYTIKLTDELNDFKSDGSPVKTITVSRADDYGYTAERNDCIRTDTSWQASTSNEFNSIANSLPELFTNSQPGTLYYKYTTNDNFLTIYVRMEQSLEVLYTINIYSINYGFPYAFVERHEDSVYRHSKQIIDTQFIPSNEAEFNSAKAQLIDLFN